ncbi:MAG TPA: protein kinase [Terriglobales bacterium]|nr:protein kinase [Terriglobales bacterium]
MPDHELLRRIGRGGYGEVWLARNMMGAYRAVKFVHRSYFDDERPFKRELAGIENFEPISRSHEGFVDILQVGNHPTDGGFFYVMELGDDESAGQDIDPDRYCAKTLAGEIRRNGRFSGQACLELGLSLSLALAELHKHHLVHRDIKPSNIIFVNGIPKLADIGLVTQVEDTCSIVGTEGFIAPEGPGTPAADVYSLGKVLYEALTGKDRLEFPELPTALGDYPDQARILELNEIIRRACDQVAARRYQTAWEMHADLVAVANGRSIRRLRRLERQVAWLKRVGWAVGVSAVALVVLGHSLYGEWKVESESKHERIGANVVNGNHFMEVSDFGGALPFFASAIQSDTAGSQDDLRHRLTFAAVHERCAKLTQIWFFPHQIEQVGFSPDGNSVFASERRGGFYLRRMDEIAPFLTGGGIGDQLLQGALSPDGQRALGGGSDGWVTVWSLPDGRELLRVRFPAHVRSVAFSPDGNEILAGTDEGIIRLLDSRSGGLLMTFIGHTGTIRAVAFSPHGDLICSAGHDSTARLWDPHTGLEIGKPMQHPDWLSWCGFSPDGKRICTSCFDHRVRIWDVDSLQLIPPVLDHNDAPQSVTYSPDGRLIATACLDHSVRLWNASDHQPWSQNAVLWHSDRVTHVAFGPDSDRLVSAAIDGSGRIWDLAGAMVAPPGEIRSWSDDRTRFFEMGRGHLKAFDTLTGRPVSDLPLPNENWKFLCSSRGGQFAVTSDGSKTSTRQFELIASDENSGKAVMHLAITNEPKLAAVSDDGTLLAASGDDFFEAWQLPSRTRFFHQDFKNGYALPMILSTNLVAARFGLSLTLLEMDAESHWHSNSIAFPVTIKDAKLSPDQTMVAICGADLSYDKWYCQLFYVATGRPASPPFHHDDGVLCVDFSVDGKHLVSGGEDNVADVWTTSQPDQPLFSVSHHRHVMDVKFHPSGAYFVTASLDQTARLWNSDTGDPLTPPLAHLERLVSARWLPDGSHLLTADSQDHGWLWNFHEDQRPTSDLIAISRLLSGDSSHLWNVRRMKPYKNLWLRLKAAYGTDFHVTQEERERWHEFQAKQCETEKDWSGAAFHLRRLQKYRLRDKETLNRLDQIEQRLAANN